MLFGIYWLNLRIKNFLMLISFSWQSLLGIRGIFANFATIFNL